MNFAPFWRCALLFLFPLHHHPTKLLGILADEYLLHILNSCRPDLHTLADTIFSLTIIAPFPLLPTLYQVRVRRILPNENYAGVGSLKPTNRARLEPAFLATRTGTSPCICNVLLLHVSLVPHSGGRVYALSSSSNSSTSSIATPTTVTARPA